MGISMKDNIQKFLGYTIASLGILIMLLGIAMFLTSKAEKEMEAGAGIAVFSISIVLIGTVLIYFGHKNAKFEEQVETVASIVKSYRRIKLYDLAEKMHTSVHEANRALSKAISIQLVKGNFDRTTDEFFTDEGKYERTDFKFCPACGAPFSKKFLEGETMKCGSCGVIV